MAPPDSCDVAIVGAGAAGLATAIFARRLNPSRSVVLLDGAKKPGAKILVSGGGRCNVTNVSVTDADFNGGRRSIIRRVLRGFPVADTVAFFRAIGVPLHEEADGKLFPDSNRARDVVAALLREAEAAGVVLRAGHRVRDLAPTDEGFRLVMSEGDLHARHVVLATGGRSLPKSGSDGAGLDIARRLGHTIVPTTPALVPLRLAEDEPLHRRLTGVAMHVELTVRADEAVTARIRGALLWTHFGTSGPATLDVSRHWLRAGLEGRTVALTASFCPGERFEDVEAWWTRAAAERPRASVPTVLATRLPASAAGAIVGALGLDAAPALAHLPRSERRRLAHALVEWPLPVTGSRGYNYAEVTAGGVDLGEIDSAAMASRVCRGLFLVGEILDVDGRVGGFNFQWAWASARVAARALAV